MSQYLKINSKVLNADTIIGSVIGTATSFPGNPNEVWVITKGTGFFNAQGVSGQSGYFLITTGSAAEAQALLIAINKALTANPGGRVVEVTPSSDYTISSIVYKRD
jgi:hypothetical protein